MLDGESPVAETIRKYETGLYQYDPEVGGKIPDVGDGG
jgi:hypothetical protein